MPPTITKSDLLVCGFVAWSKLIPILVTIIVLTIAAATFITAQHGSINHHSGAMSADRFDDFRKQFERYTTRQSEMNLRIWEALKDIREEVKKR